MKKIALFFTGLMVGIGSSTLAATTIFTDENEFADWNRQAIFKANANGLMTGFDDGHFGANEYMTRGQLAVILDRLERERIPEIIKKIEADGNASETPKKINVSVDDDSILGESSAPITMIQFVDYQDPFSKRFYLETLPTIQKNYIDTKKIKYIVRDFPLSFHYDAKNAALGAECIKEQGGDGKYFEYYDKLLENQNNLGLEDLKKYASEIEMDSESLEICVNGKRYINEVEKDVVDGQIAGVNGTPYFFINGTPIAGAQEYGVYESIIEDEIEKLGKITPLPVSNF